MTDQTDKAAERKAAAAGRSPVMERMRQHLAADPLRIRQSTKQLRPGTVTPDGRMR